VPLSRVLINQSLLKLKALFLSFTPLVPAVALKASGDLIFSGLFLQLNHDRSLVPVYQGAYRGLLPRRGVTQQL
jgi:hypothetical protein